MQNNKGFYRFLSNPVFYEIIQRLSGRDNAIKRVLKEINIQSKSSLLDIGCGTGELLKFLPSDICYTGIDLSKEYIDSAKSKFPQNNFYCCSCDNINIDEKQKFKYVFAFGLFHHIDDAIFDITLLKVQSILDEKDGVFILFEPCYLEQQSKISKFVMGKDRGAHIRTQNEWEYLFKTRFPNCKSQIFQNLYRIPYRHILLKGYKNDTLK